MKRLAFLPILLVIPLAFAACNAKNTVISKQQSSITISAASSLKEFLDEAKKDFYKSNPEITLTINFGASGTLKKQIEEGANVDLFISADAKNVTDLKDKNLLEISSVKNIASNALALVVNKKYSNKINNLSDLPQNASKIAIATPEKAPAGTYAKESLTNLQIFDKIKNKLVYGSDVKTTLTYIENGDVDAGIVFLSDTLTLKECIKKEVVPTTSHKPILYSLGIVSSSKEKEACKKFSDFLCSKQGQTLIKKHGFIPIGEYK